MSEGAPAGFYFFSGARLRIPALLRLGLILLSVLGCLLDAASLTANERSPGGPSTESSEPFASPDSPSFDGAMHDPDPWEKMNRGVFWINEKGDI